MVAAQRPGGDRPPVAEAMAQQKDAAAAAAAAGGSRPEAAELIGSSLARLIKLCGRDRKLAQVATAAKELKEQLNEVGDAALRSWTHGLSRIPAFFQSFTRLFECRVVELKQLIVLS